MGRLFVAVPVTVAALATAVVVTPAIGDALGERESRRLDREYERAVAPAHAALRGMRADGLESCAARDAIHTTCLRADTDSRTVATATEKALRGIGATDVASRCRDSRSGAVTACTVTARLHGADVHGMAVPVRVAGKPTGALEIVLMVSAPHP